MKFDITLQWEFEDVDRTFTVEGDYKPSRPAPDVKDHDAPGFADPGDPAEIEIHEIKEYGRPIADALKWFLQDHEPFMDRLYEMLAVSWRGDYE